MKILKAKLESGIGRAEEYRLLGENHPEGLKVHIQYIKDLMKPLIGSLRCQLTRNEEVQNSELLAAAKRTLKNLHSELATTEHGVVCPAISKVRENLEISSGQKLPSFDGNVAQFRKFQTSFSNSIRKDPSISDTEKLVILKSCLTGAPFNFVDAFPTSSTNYSLALKLLKDVYSSHTGITELYLRLNELPQVSMNDGAKFQETYRQLESILLSMEKFEDCVDVNEDLGVKFLYLRKFTERTLLTVLVGEADMSLSEIRREIRHLINVDELHSLAEDAADNLEGSVPSEERPTVSQISSNRTANTDGLREIAGVAANGNKSTMAKRNTQKKSPTLTTSKSCEQNSIEQISSEAFEMSLPTMCANAICEDTNRKTSVRLLFQDDVKISLMTEVAAKRLGIRVPLKKTLPLCTSDSIFKATMEYFSLKISGDTSEECSVSVHIVDKTFSAQDVPGADINDFRKLHPEISYLHFEDSGEGRPIDIFLCSCYYNPLILNHCVSSLKSNWQLQTDPFFGLLLQGPVEKNDRQSYSYRFPENYEVPYSELACQHF